MNERTEKLDPKWIARRHLQVDDRQLFNISKEDLKDLDQRIAKRLAENQEMRDVSLILAQTRLVG